MTDDEDEVPQLSADTLSALKDFYNDRDARQKHFEDLKNKAEDDAEDRDYSIEDFGEDWQISQFWYTDDTALTLAKALLDGSNADTHIAVVSAPSVFIQMRKLLIAMDRSQRPQVKLLEFDERFAVLKEFVQYDFAHPTRLPAELKGRFDRIICDPPFLSPDCQTKAALTARWLSKSWLPPALPEEPAQSEQRVILCTGERMESLALKLYDKAGVRTTSFLPQHTKGLSNEFRCYANFATANSWTWAGTQALYKDEPENP